MSSQYFFLCLLLAGIQTSVAKWPNYPLNQTVTECWQCITFSSNWKEEPCSETEDKFACRTGTLACLKIVKVLPEFNNEKLGLKNVIIRACYPHNEWQFIKLGKNSPPDKEGHTHNAVFMNPRVTTKSLCNDLIEAHVSRYSWLEEFSADRYRDSSIQGEYANVTKEEATARKKDWQDLCDKMNDTDITEPIDSKTMLRCKNDLCNEGIRRTADVTIFITTFSFSIFLAFMRP